MIRAGYELRSIRPASFRGLWPEIWRVMHPVAHLIAVFLAGSQAGQFVLSAADKPTIHIQATIPNIHPEEPFLTVQARLNGSVFDPAADALLSSTDAQARKVFRIPDAKLDRSATYRTSDGDCLVCRVAVSERQWHIER